MFVLFTTKPNSDGTKGFRYVFKLFGRSAVGIYRKRKHLSVPMSKRQGKCSTIFNIGKLYLTIEQSTNKTSSRKFRHFAG